MKLSDENRSAFFIQLHKSIEESANTNAGHIFHGRTVKLINYPPNGGLTGEELTALEALKGNENLKAAIRKIIASSTADVLFDMFNLIDGTSDPDPGSGDWSEIMLVDKDDEFEENVFLHDYFFESYWHWKEKRVNTNWSLDKER